MDQISRFTVKSSFGSDTSLQSAFLPLFLLSMVVTRRSSARAKRHAVRQSLTLLAKTKKIPVRNWAKEDIGKLTWHSLDIHVHGFQ
jgi:hypothetical protein